MLLSSYTLSAQQDKTIKGIVTSLKDAMPLPGVNVLIKGTNTVVVTDFDGEYLIQATSNDILVFSYIGFANQEVTVGNKSQVNVVLNDDLNKLDEVVVVGYGTQKKSDITGSISVLDVSEVNKVANSDVSQLLQGRVAGVMVTSGGEPGANANIRIRGVGTFGNNQPLYVVDGVPVGTSIRDFNPEDIKTMQVLKDASAGAIYGSRAANGVVIITTKKGSKNMPLKINYSAFYGIDQVSKKIPVLNRENYQMIVNEKESNAGLPLISGNDPNSSLFVHNIDTDWQAVGLKTGKRESHNLNFSGGGENVTYNTSLNYYNNEGLFEGNGPTYERYTTRTNLVAEKGIFKISPSLFYSHSFENSLTFRGDILTGGRPPLINDLVFAIPTLGVYDSNNIGGYAGTSSQIHQTISLNVPGINNLFTNTVEVDRIFAILNPEVKLINRNGHELTYKLNLSYDKTFARDFSFVPQFEMGYFFGSGISRLDDNTRIYTVGLVENTLNYTKSFGKHSLEALLGQTYQENSTVIRTGHSENLPIPYYPILSNGTNQSSGGFELNSALSSYFGRVNYNFDDKYLLTGTVRRDGSSRFAPQNRFGTFPSVAFGWKITNEKFFKVSKDIISQLKLRGSYGQLGNENIGDYLYQPIINRNILYNFGGSIVTGGLETSLVLQDIKWETTTSSDIGIDGTFLNNSVDLSLDYYKRKTNDVLVGVPIPASTGSINTAPTVNAGSLQNSGFEVEATYHSDNSKQFTFDISVNASTLKNRVLALGGNNEPIYGVGSRTQVGGEIGEHFGHVYEGIFQTDTEVSDHAFQSAGTGPGDIIYKDLNGDGIINADDRTSLGSATPSVTYGLNFTAKFKNFDFTLFASGAAGYYINSGLYRILMSTSDYGNSHEDILNRWTPTNTNTSIPRLMKNDANNNGRDSNRPGWLQKGDHLRLNTISVGYSIPEKVFKGIIQSPRVYTTLQNVYTFQKYKGFNPDFNSGVFNPGFDAGSYPRPITFMLGAQLSF
ncbi:TonB-dependent receptor [Flavobacterium sp. RSP49]|nr:TonB-dependent receptor [Flavobacterium sp. RSP49]